MCFAYVLPLISMAAVVPGSVPEREEAFGCSGSAHEPWFGSQQGHLA